MAASYQSKDSLVLGTQLKVQELVLTLADTIISNSGSVCTVDVKEPIVEVRSASFLDDSAGTGAPITAANRVISGTTVALTLSAAMAANDCITLKYVVTG